MTDQGDTRDVAAKAAGLGIGKTYEVVKHVLEHGTFEIVDAMDKGAITINSHPPLAAPSWPA